jgi:predicted permease
VKILQRLRYLLRQRQIEAELAEEIEFHRSLQPEPREMGNLTRAREDARAVWIRPWLQSIWQDGVYALRNLRRQPGFTVVALLTLGVAIGLNTSFFTVFNAIVLRTWPVQDPSRVVQVFQTNRRVSGAHGFSPAEFRYLAAHATTFSGMVARRTEGVQLGFEAFGKGTRASFVSGNYFDVLGVRMRLGRGFLPEEDQIGEARNVTVLSHTLWRDHFGGDPQIIGKQIRLDEVPFTVVGVASEAFTGAEPGWETLWMPLAALPVIETRDAFGRDVLLKADYCCSSVAGRLRPGVSRAAAEAELKILSRQFHAEYKLDPQDVQLTGITFLENPNSKREILPVLALMFLALTLVLLLACANTGNLLLARATARQREIEVRRCLGAGRARIVRQLLTESLVLALGACGIGVWLAFQLPAPILRSIDQAPPFDIRPDAMVLAYALAVALFSCVCFGLAPALHGTRRNSAQSRLRLRQILLAAQVAISAVLLIGAGLLLRGVSRARGQDVGFAVEDISVVSFDLPHRSYDEARTRAFFSQLLDALNNTSGVHQAGLAGKEPLSGAHWQRPVYMSGQTRDQATLVDYEEVSPGYFDVLRIPILAGRNFETGDEARHAIVVNEAMARRYWSGENPVGKAVNVGGEACEVVGVVRDAYTTDLNGVTPIAFVPFRGVFISDKLLVRSDSPAATQAAAIAAAIDPRARTDVAPLEATLNRWLSGSRVGAEIAGMLGIFALILTAVGMAGVFSYAVVQRTKEIGIRMALGARPDQMIGLVWKQTLRAILAGLGLGFFVAALAAQVLRHQLFGVSPLDPFAYLAVAAVLVIAGLAASIVPAHRATSVDPMTALRHE